MASHRLAFLLQCLLLATGLTCFAYETIERTVVEDLSGGVHLIRVPETTYVALDMPALTIRDFEYTKTYAYQDLMTYFDGKNYHAAEIDLTTPLFLETDIFDSNSRTLALFLIPQELQTANDVPAPKGGRLKLKPTGHKYYYVKETQSTNLRDLFHEAADILTDLSYERLPFTGSVVRFAFYEYPVEEQGAEASLTAMAKNEAPPVKHPNEIWIERWTMDESRPVT